MAASACNHRVKWLQQRLAHKPENIYCLAIYWTSLQTTGLGHKTESLCWGTKTIGNKLKLAINMVEETKKVSWDQTIDPRYQ